MVTVPQEGEFGLYFHIPFCNKKCDYCHFYVIPNKDDFKLQLMEGLRLEWQKRLPAIQGKRLVSVYFGGGTPFLLGPEFTSEILGWVQESFPFAIHRPEVTMEANPENITYDLMRAYALAGINRVSIGVQSLDDSLLVGLTRQHSAQHAADTVRISADAGISNISIDLMYDLPHQTLGMWEKTLVESTKLPITHLSLYNLTIEPHTAFHKYRKRLEPFLPPEETSAQMYVMAKEVLEESGLKQYEISAFAREGKFSIHNTGYWMARPFLGLGPSAFSYWEGKRFRNVANLSKYLRALKSDESPVDFDEELSPEARRRELLFVQLRLRQGVDIRAFESRHGHLEQETKETLSKLTGEGFFEQNGNVIALTWQGMLFYDTVAADLI